MEFNEPAVERTDSFESGRGPSGNGPRARRDTAETLFFVVIVVHLLAVILALYLIGSYLGPLPVSLAFVGVTIGWLAWIRKYQRDQEARRITAEVDAARRRAATFTDPRQ